MEPDTLLGTFEFDASEKEALDRQGTMLPALGFSKLDLNPTFPGQLSEATSLRPSPAGSSRSPTE